MDEHLVTWYVTDKDPDWERRCGQRFDADDGYVAAYEFYQKMLANSNVACVTMWAAIPVPEVPL